MAKTIHGMAKTRLHRIWNGMRYRCTNPNVPEYKNYGGKGIVFCDEWLEFSNFHKWAIANNYNDTLTIERIDVNSNYSPSNCTWVSFKDQQKNKRNTLRLSDGSRALDVALSNGIKAPCFYGRLHIGWSVDKAATTPVFKKGGCRG